MDHLPPNIGFVSPGDNGFPEDLPPISPLDSVNQKAGNVGMNLFSATFDRGISTPVTLPSGEIFDKIPKEKQDAALEVSKLAHPILSPEELLMKELEDIDAEIDEESAHVASLQEGVNQAKAVIATLNVEIEEIDVSIAHDHSELDGMKSADVLFIATIKMFEATVEPKLKALEPKLKALEPKSKAVESESKDIQSKQVNIEALVGAYRAKGFVGFIIDGNVINIENLLKPGSYEKLQEFTRKGDVLFIKHDRNKDIILHVSESHKNSHKKGDYLMDGNGDRKMIKEIHILSADEVKEILDDWKNILQLCTEIRDLKAAKEEKTEGKKDQGVSLKKNYVFKPISERQESSFDRSSGKKALEYKISNYCFLQLQSSVRRQEAKEIAKRMDAVEEEKAIKHKEYRQEDHKKEDLKDGRLLLDIKHIKIIRDQKSLQEDFSPAPPPAAPAA